MKKAESEELLDAIWHKFCKKGIPINIKNSQNIDIADYIKDVVAECIEIEEPLGVVKHNDYDACPVCLGTIGTTGYYCRFCGALIHYKPEKERG